MVWAYFNIILEGTVYFTRRSIEDDEIMQLYSNNLVGTARESTFDILYSILAANWRQQDDIVTVFHDERYVHVESVWTFDLERDVLRFDKKDHKLSVSLSIVRQRPINLSDFEPYELPTPFKHALPPLFPIRYCKFRRERLNLPHLERKKIFVRRVLSDFGFQWRHILCGRYNNSTFRKLANAIIMIATLDFNISELTLPRRSTGNGFLVWISELPEWNPLSGNIFRVGGTSIVVTQHITHAMTLIRRDFAARNPPTVFTQSPCETSAKCFTYLILSVREVMLYRISSDSKSYTKPEPLFDGTHIPSDDAIDLLLEATHTDTPTSPIHNLPLELQDMILDKVSAGPIESARVGCILDAGSIFDWRSGNRDIERKESRRNRFPWSTVESHILFGNSSSGVAYK